MATYTKSYSSDFGSSLKISQFHTEISNEVGITPNISGVTQEDDVVYIIFDSSLSAGEQITLNSVISNHVPVYASEKKTFFGIDFTGCYYVDPNEYYTLIKTFEYAGSDNIGLINEIEVVCKKELGPTSYDVQIITENDDIIAEVTGLTNELYERQNMGTITNVPSTETILEVYVRKIGGVEHDHVYISNMIIYHNNKTS